ncbi:MAG: Polysaccharide deacetylase [Burkholderiaceae bacterium]|nr:MAG: Polysaccharide deacetylase [Burkholderiaceae bacterium]
MALHALLALLLAWHWRWWPVLLAVLLADHALIAAQSLWPRSQLLGANLVRLPAAAAARGEVAITIDDGPDPEVTPVVLALLAQHGAKATFFCIGERAAQHPALCRAIVAAGHEIGNHGQRHRRAAPLLGLSGWRREVGEAQRQLTAITGRAPRFFRAMAGLRNPWLDPVLHGLGLELASWTRRGFDTRSGDSNRVLARLLAGLAPGDILLLHDGHAARTEGGEPVILAVLPRLLDTLASRGLRPVTLACACTKTEGGQHGSWHQPPL